MKTTRLHSVYGARLMHYEYTSNGDIAACVALVVDGDDVVIEATGEPYATTRP